MRRALFGPAPGMDLVTPGTGVSFRCSIEQLVRAHGGISSKTLCCRYPSLADVAEEFPRPASCCVGSGSSIRESGRADSRSVLALDRGDGLRHTPAVAGSCRLGTPCLASRSRVCRMFSQSGDRSSLLGFLFRLVVRLLRPRTCG